MDNKSDSERIVRLESEVSGINKTLDRLTKILENQSDMSHRIGALEDKQAKYDDYLENGCPALKHNKTIEKTNELYPTCSRLAKLVDNIVFKAAMVFIFGGGSIGGILYVVMNGGVK